ncbi:MAG: hypothetical protein ACI4EU_04000 [Butyrivibrio sp.]
MGKDILFDIPLIGKFIKRIIIKSEGGEAKSGSLRRYYERKFGCTVELYTYGCFRSDFNVGGKVRVGRYCSIADGSHYFGANHPMELISSSAYFYNKSLGLDVKDVERNTLEIGNDVWIGFNSLITCNCHSIGNGAVIGAGSVVTKDVPPYAIVAGNPARIIRYRFNEEDIGTIENSKWWEKSPDCLVKYYDYMNCPEKFVKELNGGNMMKDQH